MVPTTDRDRTLRLANRPAGVTARELTRRGIHPEIVSRLVAAGELQRIARGIYRLADETVSEYHGLAIVASAAPQGVICLLSALAFHRIGTQLPREVWLAVKRGARRPALRYPPLRIVHPTGSAFTLGIEIHPVEGREVRIYGIAKTLVDCFKYRNKIGLDVALEALQDAWRSRRFRMAELDRIAAACRMQRVMQPYLELLLA